MRHDTPDWILLLFALFAGLLFGVVVWFSQAEAASGILKQWDCEIAASSEWDSVVGSDSPQELPRAGGAHGYTVNSLRKSYRINGFNSAAAETTKVYGTIQSAVHTHLRFYVFIPRDFDLAGNRGIFAIQDGGTIHVKLRVTSAEVWQINTWNDAAGPSGWASLAVQPSDSVMTQIDICARSGNLDGDDLFVWINGQLAYNLNVVWAVADFDNFWWGPESTNPADSGYIYFDDFAHDATACVDPICTIPPVKADYGFPTGFGGF